MPDDGDCYANLNNQDQLQRMLSMRMTNAYASVAENAANNVLTSASDDNQWKWEDNNSR